VEEPFDPSRPTFDLVTPRRAWDRIVEAEVKAGREQWPSEYVPIPGVDYEW
jgi:hypothetical protein